MTRLGKAFWVSLALLCWCGRAPAPGEDWPQFLGPNRNGVSQEAAPRPWPEGGPPVVWRTEVGEGFSAPVVAGGRLVIFHRRDRREVVDCLDAENGEKIWSHDYPTSYRDDFGFNEGPRGTPAIAGGRVYTFGAQGVLTCLDLASGRRIWQVETHSELGVRKGFFGAAVSPLVDGGRVLLNVGGSGERGLVAFEAETGKVLWASTDHQASYSSPTVAPLHGVPYALFFTRNGLVATDPSTGRVRFEYPWRARAQASVNAATPVVVGHRIFLSASYRTGGVLLEVDEELRPREIWSSKEVLSNHYATSVYHDGYLYGFHGRQEYGPSLRSVAFASGEVKWNVERFGAGTLTLLRDHLLVVREDGTLFLAAATPEGFKPLAQAQVLPPTVRAYPAVSGGRLYLRNDREMVALDLGGGE